MSTAYSSAKQQYIGNGVTTEWGFDFPIKKHSELKVYLKRSGLSQVLLEEGVDYSFVTENTITFPIKTGEAKLQATDVLALQRESVFESEYNFSNQQRLEPEEVMHADDNLERQIQELKRDSESSIKVLPTSNVDPNTFFEHVERVYGSVDNIDTVANDKANVDKVAGSITNVNKTAGSIDNVNVVAPSISSVNTVASNISSVNTAASNMATIKAAPTAAANAAQSAANAANSATISANSAIWAEGTDAQVQSLGGVHSSKGWAEQSTNANIALTNSPYTTNRILEIPQDIKLELNNGTLTLKAGSKVYVPNSPGVFTELSITSDITIVSTTLKGRSFIFADGSDLFAENMNTQSGSTFPSSATTGVKFYNTTENKFYRYNGSEWKSNGYSFPLAIVTLSSGSVTSIDQVFNGFGYIGSTIFGLPGIKCLVGNGRNPDGSCRTKIEESTKVSTFTMELHRLNNKIALRDGIVGVRSSLWFDEQVNMCYNNTASAYQPTAILGTFSTETTSPWNIKEFNPLGVDSVLNSSLSNLSAAGQAKFDAKANVSNTVTTDTNQTISGVKTLSVAGTAARANVLKIMMPTSTESNPTESSARTIDFFSQTGSGNRFEGGLVHQRFVEGGSYTGLRAGKLIDGTFKEGVMGVRIWEDGTTFGTAPSTPANPTSGNVIATVDWVNTAIANKANINADNFSVAGKAALSGLGMPSNMYIDLTLGANGSTYTAPANGWFYFLGKWTNANSYFQMRNKTISPIQPRIQTMDITASGYWGLYMPVRAGDNIAINYHTAPTEVTFAFIYAQGEQ